jgi:hypothetical protein
VAAPLANGGECLLLRKEKKGGAFIAGSRRLSRQLGHQVEASHGVGRVMAGVRRTGQRRAASTVANGDDVVRRPVGEGRTRGAGLLPYTASLVPCHGDQNTSHGPAVGGGARRAHAMRAGRRATTTSRVWPGRPDLISTGPV